MFKRPVFRISRRCILVLASPSPLDNSRLGVVVAKKHVRLASERNKFKRHIREYFRHNPLHTPLDLIVMSRSSIDSLDVGTVKRELNSVWSELQCS